MQGIYPKNDKSAINKNLPVHFPANNKKTNRTSGRYKLGKTKFPDLSRPPE